MVNCSLLNLKQLNLSNSFCYSGVNLIGNIGIKFLTKVDLPNLVKIWIGNYKNIQITVTSEAKG